MKTKSFYIVIVLLIGYLSISFLNKGYEEKKSDAENFLRQEIERKSIENRFLLAQLHKRSLMSSDLSSVFSGLKDKLEKGNNNEHEIQKFIESSQVLDTMISHDLILDHLNRLNITDTLRYVKYVNLLLTNYIENIPNSKIDLKYKPILKEVSGNEKDSIILEVDFLSYGSTFCYNLFDSDSTICARVFNGGIELGVKNNPFYFNQDIKRMKIIFENPYTEGINEFRYEY